jgi:ribosomal protein S27AE
MNQNEIDKTNKGWECPKCGKINAPHINQCSCVKENMNENNQYIPTSNDGRKILTESR